MANKQFYPSEKSKAFQLLGNSLFVVDDAHLVTTMLNEDGDFSYTIKDEHGFIYSMSFANISDLDFILSVIENLYGKNTRTYEYWLTMSRELKTEI